MDGRLEVERADVVIIGAGLAGTSVALRLAGREYSNLSVVILDPRTEFPNDRTWCSWRMEPHPFQEDLSASWRRLALRWPGGTIRIEPSVAYDCLPAKAFYSKVLPRLESAPNISLRLGVRALRVQEREASEDSGMRRDSGFVVVEHEDGRIEADVVFDSRPPETPAGALVQHFLGWEIETEEEAFDHECALLMDFDVDQEQAIHFIYVLPLSRQRALIESTWIGPPPEGPVSYARHLRSWIDSHIGAVPWRLLRREHGCLPMTGLLAPARHRSRHVRIGIGGGALRPSSGYAFSRIQQASDHFAAELRGGTWRTRGVMPARLDSRLDAFMDQVFLSFLKRYPERAPAIFASLFSSCQTDRLIRFLSGKGNILDRCAVMLSLPTGPFLREALRGVFHAR